MRPAYVFQSVARRCERGDMPLAGKVVHRVAGPMTAGFTTKRKGLNGGAVRLMDGVVCLVSRDPGRMRRQDRMIYSLRQGRFKRGG